MMTRKDYIATAEILKDYKDEMSKNLFQFIVYDFADLFEADNPNFNENKFYSACGLEIE